MRAGTAPRVVLPRVRLVLTSLPVRAGTASRVAQPAWSSSFLLLDISTCRRRHHSVAVLRITVVVSARAVTARPEAPECFSPSQPSSFNRRLSSAKLSTVAQAVVTASAVVLVIFSQRPRSSCSPMDTSSLFARPVPGLLILYKSTQYFGMCRIDLTN